MATLNLFCQLQSTHTHTQMRLVSNQNLKMKILKIVPNTVQCKRTQIVAQAMHFNRPTPVPCSHVGSFSAKVQFRCKQKCGDLNSRPPILSLLDARTTRPVVDVIKLILKEIQISPKLRNEKSFVPSPEPALKCENNASFK